MISINSKEPTIYVGSKKVQAVYVGNTQVYPTKWYGVEWDVTNSSPNLTRIGNLELHKTLPIQSQFKGCVSQGTNIQYYLDAEDWSKKEDGTTSVLDGTDGVVRVHTPKFYHKTEADGNKRRIMVSLEQVDSTWEETPAMLIDAYRPTQINTVPSSGYLNTLAVNTLVSVVNTTAALRGGNNSSSYDSYLSTDVFKTQLGKSRTSLSRANARTRARQSGSELINFEQYQWIFYWLYVIEYASFNSQAAFNANLTAEGYHQGGLGNGVTTGNYNRWTYYNSNYPLIPCGYCNDIGNGTGVKNATIVFPTSSDGTGTQSYTFAVPRWRGFDNPFGHIWTNVDGIIIDTPKEGETDTSVLPTVYIISNPDNYTDSLTDVESKADKIFTMPHLTGFITKWNDDDGQINMIPAGSTGGSSTTYMCDQLYIDYNDTPVTLLLGGRAGLGSYAGLGSFYSYYGVGNTYPYVGFRTLTVLNN